MIDNGYRCALLMILIAASGCKDDDNDDGGDNTGAVSAAKLNATCQSYCDQAKVCDADVAVDTCVSDCKDKLGNCMVDEQSEAVDDLDVCADKACDDFTGCTIGAGLKCTFGL
jgi:hypothetical protein